MLNATACCLNPLPPIGGRQREVRKFASPLSQVCPDLWRTLDKLLLNSFLKQRKADAEDVAAAGNAHAGRGQTRTSSSHNALRPVLLFIVCPKLYSPSIKPISLPALCLLHAVKRSSSTYPAAMATRHMVRRDAGAKRSSLTASGEIIFRNLIILIINQNFLMTQQFAKRHRPNYTFTNDSAPQHSQAGDSRFPFYPIT
ncbi:hypothetical protein T4B_5068 [Trichinella pseudospiralis]|uniref:Uncharacterized protein n=2 Tax=Trichinella pseudospiralis TaxID=6337 RepID=A0A0V1FNH7_TRIPS|nr:hypothetical protein T4E_10529 [Trichinella pseudospiralis]KRY87568.1 hypothetical protein T4D_11829 [Trichinella pseudospiralis]KRZ17957.1 hypothetical protein T4B_5068 [Trichinella pseudospiralis]KRZ37535.1 hypothetical protein T4C_11517 [Trichinella pseudospiralis]